MIVMKTRPAVRAFCRTRPFPVIAVKVSDPFWDAKIKLVLEESLASQLEKYEENNTLHNFRVVAGREQGFHLGWFYQDSDLYKWMEAVSYCSRLGLDEKLKGQLENLVELVRVAQAEDGYLNTYYQTYFPGRHWSIPYITHELYCAGHLFEAAVANAVVTGKTELLDVACKFADLIVHEHAMGDILRAPGHPEIELALVKLYRQTGQGSYLDLADKFVRQRGTSGGVLSILGSVRRFGKEQAHVRDVKAQSATKPGETVDEQVSEDITAIKSRVNFWRLLRVGYSMATGRYAQDHKPVLNQEGPVGHAVRALYLYAGMTDIFAEKGDPEMLRVLQATWRRMTAKRMYVTGGVGSMPVIEGFGRDYELPNEGAYAETCACIGNFKWNWRMIHVDPENMALYAELMERCLYNGILSGFGLDGHHYFYENPLESRGDITRKEWFPTVCCPSNIARLLGSLGQYIYTEGFDHVSPELWVHQYIGSNLSTQLQDGTNVQVRMQSDFPWKGTTKIQVRADNPKDLTIRLRIPAWSFQTRIQVNGNFLDVKATPGTYITLQQEWSDDTIELDFSMPIRFLRAHAKVKPDQGKVAIQVGPIIYCVEGVDNTNVNLFRTTIIRGANFMTEWRPELLGGVQVVRGVWKEAKKNQPEEFLAIPYHAWANREASPMRVWIPYEGNTSIPDIWWQ